VDLPYPSPTGRRGAAITDEGLGVAQARAGDRVAFAALYARYERRIYRFG
jgi:hypothetical protein